MTNFNGAMTCKIAKKKCVNNEFYDFFCVFFLIKKLNFCEMLPLLDNTHLNPLKNDDIKIYTEEDEINEVKEKY